MNLSDKIIVITGGAKGLGRALAMNLLAKKAKVIICDNNEAELRKTAGEIGAIAHVADVTDELQLSAVVEKAVSQFGRIDIWINNAGIWMPPVSIENLDMDKAEKLININLLGTIKGVKVASKHMKSQGSGTLVNIISTTAFDGVNGSSGSMYVASKYALRGFTNVLRDELKDSGIDVLAVYPGGMKTDIFNEAKPSNLDQFMPVETVAEKIVANLELPDPKAELIIIRPGQKISDELAGRL